MLDGALVIGNMRRNLQWVGRQAPYGTERGAELEAYIPSIQGTITRPLNRVVSIPLGSRCRLFIIRPPSGRAQRAKTAPEPGTSDTVETAYKVTGYKVKSLINPFRVTLRRLLSKFAYKVDFLWYKWLLYKRFLLYRESWGHWGLSDKEYV